jgi:hypothetical protein
LLAIRACRRTLAGYKDKEDEYAHPEAISVLSNSLSRLLAWQSARTRATGG